MPISEQTNENKTSVFHCNWILNYVNENGFPHSVSLSVRVPNAVTVIQK